MPAQQTRKRPWYLVVGLLAAMALGMQGSLAGWATWTMYHAQVDHALPIPTYATDAEREAADASWQRVIAAYDANPRENAFGVAMLVLGSAMVLFAMRGMAGRSSARNLLVQLVSVQAAIYVLEFFMTKGIRLAQLDCANALQRIDDARNPELNQLPWMVPFLAFIRSWLQAIFLAGRTAVSALVVFALTRPGSREFFEAAPDPAVEQ
jgi:hypothetical protein